MSENKFLIAALSLAERGLSVLPCWGVEKGRCACGQAGCESPGKHPIGQIVPHGVKDATADPEVIKKWWKGYPRANVAIATGKISEIIVLDIDPRNGGRESLAKLEQEYGKLINTYRVKTGGDGEHHYFKYTKGKINSLGPGLDIQSDGKYVLAPPSNHKSGGVYEHLDSQLRAFEPCPNWFFSNKEKGEPPIPQGDSKKIKEGERNDTLTSLAGTMRGRGFEEEAILAALLEHNQEKCEPPLAEEEVRGIATSVSKYAAGAPPPAGVEFGVYHGEICLIKNSVHIPLCNFTAEIVEEIVQDDGADTVRFFAIKGKLRSGRKLPIIRVPSGKFSGLSWVTEFWGYEAILKAGFSRKEQLREAIQRLSPPAATRYVYTHTGWREIQGRQVFLTGNGAVGMEGVEVELGAALKGYQLPRKIENEKDAMRHALRLLKVAPLNITVPLFAAMFRAPLATVLPTDFTIHVVGLTGALKSTLVSLFLSLHGKFDETHLPAGWNSTANALERQAFLLKDIPFVIDDYAPPALKKKEFEGKFGLLMRAQGNLQGRGRMRADSSLRPSYPPRGIIISTGETSPPGESLLARTFIIELERKQINLKLLGELQEVRSQFPHALAGYLVWLAPQIGKIGDALKRDFEERRAGETMNGGHLRVPGVMANLWVGVDWALRYAEEIGAVTEIQAEEHRKSCWESLVKQGKEQAKTVKGERPILRFLRVLTSLRNQGKISLRERKNKKSAYDVQPNTIVWWEDQEEIYLVPEAAFRAVALACRDSGEQFPISQARLIKNFQQEGLSRANPGRYTLSFKVEGKTSRVLCLPKDKIKKVLEGDFSGPGAAEQEEIDL